jgi:type II restriction enzyme
MQHPFGPNTPGRKDSNDFFGLCLPERQVREEFSRVRRLAEIPPQLRGWTVDVLTAIRRLGRDRFSLKELYGLESDLQRAHPNNRNIRPKIRQQLQVLRDIGLLRFNTPGQEVTSYNTDKGK